MPGLPGRIWLMDSRNWGVEPERDFPSAAEEAKWLAGVMRRMVDQLAARGWGALKATAGSQSLATWRRKHLTHEVVAHADQDILDLEESAYVGGRCECGVLGAVPGPLFMMDRRSAYAHACVNVDVPVKVEGMRDGEWSEVLGDPERSARCLAEVGVAGDEQAYPRARQSGVQYPRGRRSCVLAGPELRDAVERGAVEWVGRCVEYRTAPALSGFARDVHAARCEFGRAGDAVLEAWAKKLLVGLPGKLGQRCADWTAEPDLCPPAPWFAWWGISRARGIYRLRALAGSVQRQERGGWTYDAVPAAACWILSAARVQLLRAIRVVGWERALYYDTDSLLTDQAGYDALCAADGLVGDGLGQWRLVRRVGRAVIHGPKYYQLDDVIKCAGMPKADCEQTRLLDRFWYRQTFGQALLEGHAPSAGRRLRPYERVPNYTLGRVGDGGRVYPHVVNDW